MQQRKKSSSARDDDEVVARRDGRHDEEGSEVVRGKKGVDAGDHIESARAAGSAGRSKEEEEEERYKALEKVLEVKKSRNPDTIRYLEKKLRDKGVQRKERHPVDGLGLKAHDPPKSGHGGKFTWEGPADVSLDPAPPAVDAKDPNYVDEEVDAEAAAGAVKGEVEVAKEAKGGVSRIEVQPPLRSLLTE